ncbi:dolichyl-phosphate-mannose--protein mannosyltransferase [Corynebacterium tapiri]
MISLRTAPRHSSPPRRAADPTRFLPPAPRRYRYGRADVISTAVIGVLALVLRLLGLAKPTAQGTPVFDEKHYVPQAWDMVRSASDPILGGIESNPGYGLVVHPPLGKQLIAFGEMLFGYSPLGWRLMTAIFGTLTVLAIMELARRLSHSWLVALFAGIIALFDGVLLVASKFGMLDIFQVFFIVAAALALALDHEQMRHRLHAACVHGLSMGALGPRLGFRWWRFAAGVLLGCALAVKWSGLYYIAFFGLMSVFSDLALRRRYGAARPVLGALARDTLPALASLVAVPVAVYAWSWRAWFASETGVFRQAAVDGSIEQGSWLHALPDALASWIYYHQSVLDFHASLTSSAGHSHPWDSKPWSWLAATRPILYYSSTDIPCANTTCRSMIYLFGTPAIWWLTVPVVAWALWRLVIGRDRRMLIPVVAFAAGFLPWLAAYDRQMYFFYATALVPFTIVLLAMALGSLVGRGPRLGITRLIAREPVILGSLLVIAYLSYVVASFLYFLPLFYGLIVPDWYFNELMWLESWR